MPLGVLPFPVMELTQALRPSLCSFLSRQNTAEYRGRKRSYQMSLVVVLPHPSSKLKAEGPTRVSSFGPAMLRVKAGEPGYIMVHERSGISLTSAYYVSILSVKFLE